MTYLLFKKQDNTTYEVLVEGSNKVIGYLRMDIDGFFYFMNTTAPNVYWDEHTLISIGLKLKELNKEYEQHITTNLK